MKAALWAEWSVAECSQVPAEVSWYTLLTHIDLVSDATQLNTPIIGKIQTYNTVNPHSPRPNILVHLCDSQSRSLGQNKYELHFYFKMKKYLM